MLNLIFYLWIDFQNDERESDRTRNEADRGTEGDVKNMFTSCGLTSTAKASLLEPFPTRGEAARDRVGDGKETDIPEDWVL